MHEVDESITKLAEATVVEEAMELINDGYPLDDEIRDKLYDVGIDPDEFYAEHGDKLTDD